MNNSKAISILYKMLDSVLEDDKHLLVIETGDFSEAKAIKIAIESIKSVKTYKETINQLNKENADLRDKINDLEIRLYGLHRCCDCEYQHVCISQLDEEEAAFDTLTDCENFKPKENEHDGE